LDFKPLQNEWDLSEYSYEDCELPIASLAPRSVRGEVKP